MHFAILYLYNVLDKFFENGLVPGHVVQSHELDAACRLHCQKLRQALLEASAADCKSTPENHPMSRRYRPAKQAADSKHHLACNRLIYLLFESNDIPKVGEQVICWHLVTYCV